jgi:hypothetical protein
MGLEFIVRDGQWDKDVAGFAVFFDPRFAGKEVHSYNMADHDGWLRECKAEGARVRLALDLTVNKDMWGNGGGEADYVIEATRDSNAFAGTIAGKDGATMRGTFVQPPDVRLTVTNQTLHATGGGEFLVVMTVQLGAAPDVKADGGTARIGRRSVAFRNENIVIE